MIGREDDRGGRGREKRGERDDGRIQDIRKRVQDRG